VVLGISPYVVVLLPCRPVDVANPPCQPPLEPVCQEVERVVGLDICRFLAHLHMQRNVAGRQAAAPFTVVVFHPVAVVSVPPFCRCVRRCEGMRDSSDWVCQLLAQHGEVGVVVPVVPQCCSPLQLYAAPLCLDVEEIRASIVQEAP